MQVLHADGSTDARERVREALAAAGAAVTGVETAPAAADALAAGGTDCLVCEHDLPGGDAADLVADAPAGVPVVVYTGSGDEALAGELVAAGAAGYVPKAAGPDVLVERVRALAAGDGNGEGGPGDGDGAEEDGTDADTDREPGADAHLAGADGAVPGSALFEYVPLPVATGRLVESGAVVEAVNPAFERTFGYDAGEVVGRRSEDLLPAGEPLDGGATGAVRREVRRRTVEGLREFDLTVVPTGGDPPVVLAIYADVTERNQRRERVAVLDRVLRHDLRNGMNVIRGSAELLAEQLEGAPVEHAETILDRSDELLSLAERIRAVNRSLDRGGRPERSLDLAAALRETVATLRADYPDARIELSAPDRAPVAGDDLLELALRDVLENGVVHNDRPEPELSVRLTREDDTAVLRVADDGPGIPDQQRRLLAGEEEVTQLRHASGLGLWLVNWAVTGAGGELAFADGDPRGSVVTIRLPLVPPAGPPRADGE